jgi:hypothetical protein
VRKGTFMGLIAALAIAIATSGQLPTVQAAYFPDVRLSVDDLVPHHSCPTSGEVGHIRGCSDTFR